MKGFHIIIKPTHGSPGISLPPRVEWLGLCCIFRSDATHLLTLENVFWKPNSRRSKLRKIKKNEK